MPTSSMRLRTTTHQRVAGGGAQEHIELVGIELERLGFRGRAVDNGGQDALTTQVADLLADDLAGLGGHDRTGAHSGDL